MVWVGIIHLSCLACFLELAARAPVVADHETEWG
jgi:hypothetical protein